MKLERYREARDYVYIPFKTGLSVFDKDDAFGCDDFLVIAGSTGSAKTYLAMFMAMNAAKAGAKVLYINAEILAHEFVKRMLDMEFDFEKDFGDIDEFGLSRFIVVHQEDTPKQITFQDIDNWVQKLKPNLLVIDLFGCMVQDGNSIPALTKEYAIAYSFYPKKYKCAVIVTEQLSKENRGTIRPDENCIAGGKALSNKATKIITLYGYYRANPDKAIKDRSRAVEKTLELIIKKDRSSRLQMGISLIYMERGFRALSLAEYSEYMQIVFKVNNS